jgi:MFS family permease
MSTPGPTGAASRPDSIWSPDRRSLTLGLVFTITLVAAEALAVSTAMPIVAGDLGGLELYGWVFSAFFLGSLIGITIVGGLIDERGVLFPFVVGLGLFALGLLTCGLAGSMPMVVAGRFVQGIGGGAVPPVAYVAIGRGLPEHLRPKMFAAMSAAWVVPGLVGPAIAGFVAETWHWRAVFLGLLPLLGLAGLVAIQAMRSIPAVRGGAPSAAAATSPASARAARSRRYVLAVATAFGVAVITTGLLQTDLLILIATVIGGVLVAGYAFHALTPIGTLRLARGYPAAVLLRGVLTFAFFCVDANVTLLLQDVRGWSALAAGLALSSSTVSWSLGSWYQSRHSVRLGPERFVRLGFPIVAVGMAGVALALLPAIPASIGIPFFAVAGFGMGLAYSQFAIIVLRDAPAESQGAVSAAVSLSDALGTALGTGIAGAFIAAGVRAGSGAGPGIAAAIGMGVAVAILGFVASSRLWLREASARGPVAAVATNDRS